MQKAAFFVFFAMSNIKKVLGHLGQLNHFTLCVGVS